MHIKLNEKRNKRILFYFSIVIFLLVISGFIAIKIIQKKDYSYALNLMDQGKYTKAAKAFETMGKYKNSHKLKMTCEIMPDYEDAVQRMNEGDYAAAAQKFSKLGSFLDAKEKSIYCINSQAYQKARKLMDEGYYIGAANAFRSLSGFKNSKTMAVECVHLSEYGQAKQLYKAGEYQKAIKAFEKLEDFKDSKEMVARCLEKTYQIGLKLMKKSKYTKAKDIFSEIKDYKDSLELCVVCENYAIRAKYNKADAAYRAGKYYTAYKMYTELRSYLNSEKNAKLCIRPYPKMTVLYKNRNYSFDFAPMVIHADSNEPAYLKIYSKTGILVATVFLKPGKSLSFHMPSGTYIIKEANGTQWFGEKEMFGDDGEYAVLKTELKFSKWGMGYEITLDNSGKDGNLKSRMASRKDF